MKSEIFSLKFAQRSIVHCCAHTLAHTHTLPKGTCYLNIINFWVKALWRSLENCHRVISLWQQQQLQQQPPQQLPRGTHLLATLVTN